MASKGFPLWRLRAGIPFAELERQAWLEQRQKFSCRPLVGPHRLCEIASGGLPTTGVPGAIRALVDTAGVVAVVQFFVMADSSKMRPQARRILSDWRQDVASIEAQWDSVARPPGGARVVHTSVWMTPDRRASAWLLRDAISDGPIGLTVADERALAAVRGAADLAQTVLEVTGLDHGGGDASANQGTLPVAELGPAAVRRSVPTCPARDRQAEPRQRGTGAAPPPYGDVLAQAIPLAYPGATLGHDGDLSLVRDGIRERLVAEPSIESYNSELAVYAMQLPDRAPMAAASASAVTGRAADCRAPTELLLVKIGRSEVPTETFRLVVDDEATFIRITELEVDDETGPDPRVHVEYHATYDTDEWVGEVGWRATIRLREPRVVERTPVAAAKQIKWSGEQRVAEVSARRQSDDSVRISFLELGQRPSKRRRTSVDLSAALRLATKTVVVAHRRGEPFDTYALLARF